MDSIIYIVLFLYSLLHFYLFIGVIHRKNRKPRKPLKNIPSVSVIVAAKNEESNIKNCLEHLIRIDYPDNKLELIIINDRSSDKTKEIIQSYAARFTKVKYLETDGFIAHLRGKTNALAQAIKKSKGEFIFTTDADCKVEPSWIKEIIRYYDDDTGLICSFTLIKPENLNSGIQSYEWLYLLTLASGGIGMNKYLSCMGNNMSFRRKVYDEIGGFENLKFSVTEDFFFLHTLKKNKKWKVMFPVSSDILNITQPCLTFQDLYRQKKRWLIGGLEIRHFGIVVGILFWITSFLVIFSWIFVSLHTYLIFVLGKLLIDFLFTFYTIKKLNFYRVIKYYIPFELYLSIYILGLPITLIFDRKVVWKDELVQ